jgi:F-type H+-transporting ATPase subunit alpha
MSLLLAAPPGREAFPGDVFYLHPVCWSALQGERQPRRRFADALPIIETQAATCPRTFRTNVNSITDGQVYRSPLFNPASAPPFNVGSRSAAWAAPPDQGHEAGRRTTALDLAQYRDRRLRAVRLRLDKASQQKLNRGARLVELLKQPQYQPMPAQEQVVSLYAGTRGFMDEVPLDAVRKFETEMLEFLRNSKADIMKDIIEKKALDADLEGRLKAAIEEFKKGFRA